MGWVAYTLVTVALWTGWGFLGKVAVATATPVQVTIVYGVVVAVTGLGALATGDRTHAWSPGGLWAAVLSAALGAIGLLTFYRALEHGKASIVAPVAGAYPAFVALLALAFLSERLSALQVAGIALAIVGVTLVAAAG